MHSNVKMIIRGFVLFALTSTVRANNGSHQEGLAIDVKMEKMRSGSSTAAWMAEIVKEGTNAVPDVIPFLEDRSASMRENAAIILGSLRDPRAVRPLVGSLDDEDANVRRRAMTSLHEIADYNLSAITDDQLPAFVRYGKGTDESADLAISIIGTIAGQDGIPIVKEICESATSQIASGGGMAIIGKRKKEACLRVLARLGDQDARNRVRQLLTSQSPKDRAQGIEVVSYVGEDMVDELGPLLSDKRDAADISPSKAGDYFLRVCDLAADVIRDVFHVELDTQKHSRYTEHDLKVLLKQVLNNER